MIIKRSGTPVADVYLRDNSFLEEELMGAHLVTLTFEFISVIDLRIGDYVEVDGQPYRIRNNESIKKESTVRGWSYSVTFYAPQYELQDVLFFLFGMPERKKYHDYYNGTASQWLDLIVANMNRVSSGWSAGGAVESDAINMSFRDKSCADVLSEIVTQLDTEYHIDGKVIRIGRREFASNGLTLGQGQGNGFRDLTLSGVDDTPPVTTLYPYGSDKNIGKEYGNDYLVLPGGNLKLEKNIDKYGRIEQSKQFENIFPKGEFHVSAEIDDFVLQASDIDFDLKQCLIDGVEVIVTFQTGELAGYDLAIVDSEKGSSSINWNNELKQFKLKQNEEENALKVPGDIHFAVGDMFILTGLKMPQSYISEAENKLQSEAQKYLDSVCEKRVQLDGACDDIYFKKNNVSVQVGRMIRIVSAPLGIDREIRCTRVKKYLENQGSPYRYDITVSDFLQGQGLRGILKEIRNIPDEIVRNTKPIKEFTKRSWADVMETVGMMFDPESDYFTEFIKPLVVHTAQLVVGINSSQMNFTGLHFIPNDNDDPNIFSNTSGTLEHFTINDDGSIREWDIPANTFALDNEKTYYVYAKCERDGAAGVIYVSDQKIKLEDDPDYYHFWVGVLNTPRDGVRSWQPMYGYTEIAGEQITTGVIKDRLARLIIDLRNGEIIGKVTFTDGSSGLENVEGWSAMTQVRDYINNVLPGDLARLQAQIDDQIESWFYHYDPTLTNIPASEWTTDAMRDAHLDDTFTNLDTGQSWRFTKDGSVYGWTLMADTAASQALVLAGLAKDTADGKRRVFINQPYPPYDPGDLWVQGPTGEIMRCLTGRQTGVYVAADWGRASKYTDDTALQNFITGAYALNNETISQQIDGKIESWFQSGDPSVAWTTPALKNAHRGDVWYNTSSKMLYVYTGTAWSRIEDADAVSAAAAASAAQTAAATAGQTASTKAVIFTSTPQPPYKIGDLWLDGDAIAGTLKRATVNRTSGSYTASDWANVGIHNNAQVTIRGGLNIEATSTSFLTFGGNGGMSGVGTVRIWSGGSIGTPTFSVDNNGNVFSKGTFYIYNFNNAIDGGFSTQGTGAGDSVTRLWIGGADAATARFKVSAGGRMDLYMMAITDTDSSLRFAGNTVPDTEGKRTTLTADITNRKMATPYTPYYMGETIALRLRASESTYVRGLALRAHGGVLIRGNTSFIEESANLNTAISAENLMYYRCFPFQVTTPTETWLPTDSDINTYLGDPNNESQYFEGGMKAIVDGSFITIRILCTRYATANLTIYAGGSSTPIINEAGNVLSSLTLSKGRCCELIYFNRAWHLASRNW